MTDATTTTTVAIRLNGAAEVSVRFPRAVRVVWLLCGWD